MMPLRALIVGFVFVSFLQDSFEADHFTSVRELKAASGRVSRERRAICESLCRSKRQDTTHFEKEMSSDVCIRECVRSRREGISPSSNELMASLRSRRNANQREDNDCLNPKEFIEYPVRKPSSIRVDFWSRKPNLLISWSPVYYGINWTSYALHYSSAGEKDNIDTMHCKLIPKDQHEWILQNGNGWNYPDGIWVAIVTYPHRKHDSISMKQFGPTPRPPPTFPPTSSDVPTKLIAAISGAASGLLLLVFAFLVYRKQIKLPLPCRSSSDQRNVLVPNPRIPNPCGPLPGVDEHRTMSPTIYNDLQLSALPNNTPASTDQKEKTSGPDTFYACYFMESPSFQVQVASVVNYFRQNGYAVEMDVMNSNELIDLGPTRWAEQQIRKARNVLVFLSPGLLRLCGSDGGAEFSHQEHDHLWYELDLLRRIYTQTHSLRKMVCIILPNTRVDPRDLPSWAEITYKWPEDELNILKRLNDRPIIQPW